MMRRISIRVLSILVWLSLGSACLAKDKSAPPKCTHFVHYDKSNLSITLPTFHSITLGSAKLQSDKIQAAADLTQLFDLVQFSNCQLLDRLPPDSAQYVAATSALMDANNKLLALTVQFDAYSKDPSQAGKVAQAATASLTTAKNVQAATANPAVKNVSLDKVANDLHGELSDLLAAMRQTTLPREELWSLISEDRKTSIRTQLRSTIDLILNNGFVRLQEQDVAAFIMMPGGDGNLYFPDGLFVRPAGQPQTAPPFFIPVGYGASGLAYAENQVEFAEVRDTQLKLGTSPDAKDSQKKVRMILLPEKAMGQVNARYIAAFPVTNSQGTPIAVVSISVYSILPNPNDLENLCRNLKVEQITGQIAKLLTFGN